MSLQTYPSLNISKSYFKYTLCCVAFVAMHLFTLNASAQTYLETFGSNRIQQRYFNWKVFETTHFLVYHYDRSGKDLARFVAEQAEQLAPKDLDSNDKLKIILYNAYEDYQQSNVGRSHQNTQIRTYETGTLNPADDKMVVYFTGLHTALKTQIQTGLATILLSKKIKENGSVKKNILSAAKLNIPNWVQEGFMEYSAQGWTETSNQAWRSLLESYPNSDFYPLTRIDEQLCGQAFWKYTKERYGNTKALQFLDAIKEKGSINKATKKLFQLHVNAYFDSCMRFFKEQYLEDASNKTFTQSSDAIAQVKIPHDGAKLSRFKVSPRGADLAYTLWKDGITQVILKHCTGAQQEAVILETGEKNYQEQEDPNYPLIAWSNTGYKLAILYKKAKGLRLRIYDATKSKTYTYVVPNNRFDRALGMAIDEDNNNIILSAIRKSQTDLYYFTTKGSRMKNITNDLWDDVAPAFVTGGQKRGILFLSNRPKANMEVPLEANQMPTGPLNAFFYNTTTKSPQLFRCSDVAPNVNISQVGQYGPDNFSYLSDANGVKNEYIVVFGRDQNNKDSAYWVPATNYTHSILQRQYNPAGNLTAKVIEQDGYYNVFIEKFVAPSSNYKGEKLSQALLVEQHQSNQFNPLPNPLVKAQEAAQLDNATFNDEASSTHNLTAASSSTPDSTFIKLKAQKARIGFKPSAVSLSLDNNILFNRYQAAGFSGGSFANPSLAGLVSVHLNDVLEDYRFSAGFRLPLGNSGATYFLQFENVRRKIDWNIAFLKTANSNAYNLTFTDTNGAALFSTLGIGKTNTYMLQGALSYPLDKMRSLRFQSALRQDALVFKSIDTYTHIVPNTYKYWSMSRLEFVFDNTKTVSTNILNGTRYKVYSEYMVQLNNNGGAVYNFGFDFRNYLKIYKNLIWAFRVSAAHSGGKQKILYFLGGVDNWLNYQKAQPEAPINQETYGFQSLANNLRGYKQNARNGNSFALANSEFRYPILNSLINRPITPRFLNSLQLCAFTDVGLAWNGLFPNDKTMAKNQYLNSFPVQVNVNMPDFEKIALGYGLGIRTALSSYQIRLDAAWNKEGSPKPIWYLSLGTDF